MIRSDSAQPNPPEPSRRPRSTPSQPVDPREALGWGQRHHDHWLQRWIRSTEDLARLQYSHRMLDAVIDEIDGRDIRIGNHWLTDYASCNYLGLDLDEEIINAVPEYLAKWGTHPSWSRLLGSPILYEQIEDKLTKLLGAEDTLVLPTITHIHKTIYDGGAMAEARGASVERFRHNDLDQLEALLRANDWRRPGMILIDGVNSMTGNAPDLHAFATLAREPGALLYIADAHGFGVIGERSDAEACDYGARGNSIVRHLDESYDNVVLVGGFSKAYSSLLAFLPCPTPVKQVLKTAAPPYLYSG